MSHDRRPFAASIEKYPISILRGNEDYRNVSIDLLQKGKDHAGSSDEYALQVRLDAALGNGTIQFVLGVHIGLVPWQRLGVQQMFRLCTTGFGQRGPVCTRSRRRSRARSGACGPAGYGRVDDVADWVGIHLVTQRIHAASSRTL